MNDKLMKESARKLIPPSEKSICEFIGKADDIASEVSKKLSSRSDIDRLIGKDNLDMMQNNIRNFTRFMESILSEYTPEVFVETVKWAMRTYRSHGFSPTFFPANLDNFCEVIKIKLSPGAYKEIYPFYQWITVNIPRGLSFVDEEKG
jgi:hypothetical protein